MKSKLPIGLILGMIFLVTNAFAQTNTGRSEKIGNNKVPESCLSLLLNAAHANLNRGKSNSVSLNYKKIHNWYSDFSVVANWCYTKIYRFIQTIFHYDRIEPSRK